MSFQFFSKLDGNVTDAPVSKIDPHRAMKSLIGGTGEMSRAISKRIQEDKRQSRMARRAYRSAMRSNDPNQIMAVSRFLTEQGKVNGPGVARDSNRNIALAEKEFESRGGDLSPLRRRKEEFGSTLENRSSGSSSLSQPQGSRLDKEPGLGGLSQSQEPMAGNDAKLGAEGDAPISFAQRQREDFRSDLHKSDLLKPETPLADRELAKVSAYKRADQLGIDRAKVDKEMGWDVERKQAAVAASDASAMDAAMAESDRRLRLGLDVPAIDPAEVSAAQEEAARLKEEGNRSLLERRARLAKIGLNEKARAERYGEGGKARTNSLESAGTEGAAAQAKFDQLSANREHVNEMQSSITNAYDKASSLQFGSFYGTFRGTDRPFIPHGVSDGLIKKESGGDPATFKKSIDTASAFNSILGGKDVTVQYDEKDKMKILSSFMPKVKTGTINQVSSSGKKAVTFQNDAFSPLKDKILKASKSGGNIYQQLEEPKDRYDVFNKDNAIDKIVKAAVKANYPIELDGDLMAVPEFRTKLSNARLESGMETDKITGYTSFKPRK